MQPIKYWEIIADKLHAAGWSSGYCSRVTRVSQLTVCQQFPAEAQKSFDR
jgi:hypothetical protein